MRSDRRVVIIGGGATGTGILRDLAARGLECVLVERGDLATGTSGRFHGLLHSGARYAVKDPHSARECLEENLILKRIAPFCLEDTGGLFIAAPGDDPAYAPEWLEGCRRAGIPTEERSVKEVLELEPCVSPHMKRAFAVPDAAVDSFTLAWAHACAAAKKGAVIKTYTEVTGFQMERGAVRGVRVRHVRSGAEETIPCAFAVNAAGAWAGEVAALAGAAVHLAPDRGTLLIFNHRLSSRVLNRLRPPSDGDIFVPHGTVTIFGTTSKPASGPDDDEVPQEDVLELLEEGARLVPSVVERRVIRAFAGVRPLYQPDAGSAGRQATRGFTVIDHEMSGIAGLLSVVGGKLTTFRLMAQAASDVVAAKLGVDAPCITAREPLANPVALRAPDDEEFLCECERVGAARLEAAAPLWRRGSIGDVRRLTRLGMGPCQGAFCTVRAAGHACEKLGVSAEDANRLIAEHARERWKGMRPVMWGAQARQAELSRGVCEALLNLHRCEGEGHGI